MIRILFDEMGDAHNDIFMKMDVLPSFLKVADSYFLADFLARDYKTKEELMLGYLDYFKGKIQELKDEQLFIAFELSDQYVGGLFIAKGKKGLIKLEYGSTEEIAAWELSQKSVEKQAKDNRTNFKIDRMILMSRNAALEGINWSIERLEKLSTLNL